MYKLGILTTHPIQYQVPWFRLLAARPDIDLTVFYCMLPDARQQGAGFGVAFEWDIPLLEGYSYEVLENISAHPSVTTFRGCDTPGIYEVVRGQRTEIRLKTEDSEKTDSQGIDTGLPREGYSNQERRTKNREPAAGPWDAFIVNGWVAKSCVQLLHACRKYQVPCIVRGESNSLRPRAWWKRLLHQQLLSRYGAFLNIGKANREFYLRNGVDPEKIFFAPYCIDNDRFAEQSGRLAGRRAKIRQQWDIPEGAVCFLFCGKFEEKKRPIDILEALKLMGASGSNPPDSYHLLMVGDGELKKSCETFSRGHRLPVTFTGFLNQGEIVRAYVAADCMVLPSDNGETWGLVVNEGMACGLPAIVSDQVGCHLDLIEKNKTGAVYPCGDIERLAKILCSWALEPEKVAEMGEEASRKIKGYSFKVVVDGVMEALRYVRRETKD